ncbi:septal ring lytic transglycosylase RlpA family protein [Desulfonatronovibrio hydrogenovorans]|uniref:septal ring lytic transglycosylase RlpA family protein n=1 Tax=Desulfonatronovibrio hydrogenovorans TaxID=53245 RepID=UPI001FC9D148|nr:septal ring lytic transglycosylase RlpA family protein [Desulfonatronovibrio hydrogenovorans]
MRNPLTYITTFFLLALMGISGCTKTIHPPPAKPREPAVSHPPALTPQVSRPEPATQRQYSVMGQTYTPMSTHEGYAEEGVASWYGPKFHGQRTSNGEIFNMYEKTAAHKLLPMNTIVRVTNLDNGKEIDLRINDRGPFVGNRIIDLSFAAAREIDMIGPGTARVRVEALGAVPKEELTGIFYVQVGSFSSKENATKLKQKMQSKGYKESRLQEFFRDDQKLWRVQAGTFTNVLAAEKAHDTLLEEIPGAFIIAD